jgi:hypothetical protein
MKRSQMINCVIDKMKLGGYESFSVAAIEDILHYTEEAGMVPPEVKEPCETLYLDHTGQVVKGEDSFVFVHKWEPEDG